MKYQIKTSTRFKRDLKRCAKRGLDMQLVYDAMNVLAKDGKLPAEYIGKFGIQLIRARD